MNELTELESLTLVLRGMPTLADQQEYMRQRSMTQLTDIAVGAGVDKPAKTKALLVDQIIAKLLSGDEASTGQGVLPVEERKRGVPLPAKVASYRPDQLWEIISGWEVAQGLDEDARAAYTEDTLREYLGYLWNARERGIPQPTWMSLVSYLEARDDIV